MENNNELVRVNPIKITDTENGITYELDFSRESVKFAEKNGFKIMETFDYLSTSVPDLFFYAFRKNHKNVSRQKTDDLLERMGGLTAEAIRRLMDLYAQSGFTHIVNFNDEEDSAKNSKVTMEL